MSGGLSRAKHHPASFHKTRTTRHRGRPDRIHHSITMTHPVRLTQYSSGAGCGCKIAPKSLDEILAETGDIIPPDARLFIGNEMCDDAAAWLLDDGETLLLATTDFFM